MPDSAVSLLLPVLIGVGYASEFTFTNAPISASRALELGLVNRVYPAPGLMAETQILAAQLAAGPVGTYGLTKLAFNRAVLSNLEDVLNYEADLQEMAGKQPEQGRRSSVLGEPKAKMEHRPRPLLTLQDSASKLKSDPEGASQRHWMSVIASYDLCHIDVDLIL